MKLNENGHRYLVQVTLKRKEVNKTTINIEATFIPMQKGQQVQRVCIASDIISPPPPVFQKSRLRHIYIVKGVGLYSIASSVKYL